DPEESIGNGNRHRLVGARRRSQYGNFQSARPAITTAIASPQSAATGAIGNARTTIRFQLGRGPAFLSDVSGCSRQEWSVLWRSCVLRHAGQSRPWWAHGADPERIGHRVLVSGAR